MNNEQPTMNSKLKTKNWFSSGSALILTVVLTTLLAIVGVAFVLVARVDKMSTSAIAENKQLNLAVDSVVAAICQRLTEDVPGMQSWQEYYDYPNHRLDPGPDGTLGTQDDSPYAAGSNGQYDKGGADDIPVTGILDNIWLANLEPEIVDIGLDKGLAPNTELAIGFRHVTDLYGRVAYLFQDSFDYGTNTISPDGYDSDDDRISFRNVAAKIIPESWPIENEGDKADADGDGVADSRWVLIPDMTSKGRDIYAAVRIVDNGGMLNVNTGYKLFDPEGNPGPNGEYVDGSSQMHINLMALAERGTTYSPQEESDRLLSFRCGNALNDIRSYEYNVVRRYDRPTGPYTPFDISDELEVKNRFFIKNLRTSTRLKECWTDAFKIGVYTPFDANIPNWFARVFPVDPNMYSYRHISTTYNMDRIIDPDGVKMFGVNRINPVTDPNVAGLYGAIKTGILDADPAFVGVDALAAQMAVNIKDYADNEKPDEITALPAGGTTYYGFERPCIYISELAYNVLEHPRQPGRYYRSYAVELHKPYFEDNLPSAGQWRLAIDSQDPIPISWSGISRFHVLLAEDANAPLGPLIDFNDITPTQGPRPHNGARAAELVDTDFFWPAIPEVNSYDMYLGTDLNSVADANSDSLEQIGLEIIERDINTNMFPSLGLDPNTDYYWRVDAIDDANKVIVGDVWSFSTSEPVPQYFSGFFGPGSRIELRRLVAQTDYITIDWMVVPPFDPNVPEVVSFQRDIAPLRAIKRLWSDLSPPTPPPTLGYNNFFSLNVPGIQYFPANRAFRNVGQIGKVFRLDAYSYDWFGFPDTNDFHVKIDLRLPVFQQIFRYLTRFDPSTDFVDNDGDISVDEGNPALPQESDEFKIAGRININTAPWYVIAQLPWVSSHTQHYDLARAIADYRDINGPFTSIGELNRIVDPNTYRSIDYYGRSDGSGVGDQLTFPDLSAGDEVADDFEERDLIFARISDLVTVRSDVFTAYILVRMGTDGPQKRVIAILDRSDVYPNTGGRVKIRAVHQVPDPR